MTCPIADNPQESQARSVDELRQENTDLKREVKNPLMEHFYYNSIVVLRVSVLKKEECFIEKQLKP